jgi:hypothetical protein
MVGGTTLNARKRAGFSGAVLAAALTLGLLGSGTALATRVPGVQVTGQVTAVSRTDAITVDGHLYLILAGSPAAQQVVNIKVGQVVDLQLNGPANTSASEVISISLHSG